MSELTAAGRAALLVPFPYAIDDHQTKNAQWLVDNDAAQLCSSAISVLKRLKIFLLTMAGDRKRLSRWQIMRASWLCPMQRNKWRRFAEVSHV